VDTAFVGCAESERVCEKACVVLKNKTCGLVVCEWGLVYWASCKDKGQGQKSWWLQWYSVPKYMLFVIFFSVYLLHVWLLYTNHVYSPQGCDSMYSNLLVSGQWNFQAEISEWAIRMAEMISECRCNNTNTCHCIITFRVGKFMTSAGFFLSQKPTSSL